MTDTKETTIRAATYSRISHATDDTDVLRHAEYCREFCTLKGWEVVETYIDNDIPATEPRPEFDRLVRDLPSGKFDVVVAYEQSRLARDSIDWLNWVKAYRSTRLLKLELVRGGTVDTGSPTGRFAASSVAGANQLEKELIQQRVLDKKLTIAKAGGFAGHQRAFGWEPSLPFKDPSNGVTVRPTEAKLIQEAAAHVLAGGSLYAIAKDWNSRGITTASGSRWDGHTIGTILTRPRTAGLRQHGGEVIGKAVWPSIYELDFGIELGADPYKRICAMLSAPGRRKAPQGRAYVLRSLLRCAVCGNDLNAAPRAGQQNYGCRHCGKVFIRAAAVEEFVFSMIGPLADSPMLRDVLASEAGDDMAEVQALVALIAEDEATKTELGSMFADREIDRANFNLQADRINARILANTAKLATFRPNTILDTVGGNVRRDWETYSTDQKREIISALVLSIDVLRYDPKKARRFDPTRLVFHWRKPAIEQLCGRVFADRTEKENALDEWFVNFGA
jgi:DNA invertase Pin-like site-specific DNA recombinase